MSEHKAPKGQILTFAGTTPSIGKDVFIAPGAKVIGDVQIGDGSSIWYNTVVRGDVNEIRIGDRTNIQDGTVVHVTTKLHGTFIGNDVLIGHMAMIHGCRLDDFSFVGLGAVVMDGCTIESGAMLAAGALLTPGKTIPSGQLWGGRPARYMRKLTENEVQQTKAGPAHYEELARMHLAGIEEA